MKLLCFALLALPLLALPASAQDMPDFSELRAQANMANYPPPLRKDFVIRDFKLENGTVVPELRIRYTTLGNRNGPKVLILHGSGGQGADWLLPSFANEMFGPDKPLDARKYFIILPDNIGHGKSSKVPGYTLGDAIAAQYRLVTEELGITHLRLVMGHSMGGRQTWVWGSQYPDFMDALVPMANSPGRTSTNVKFENIRVPVLAINSADDPGNAPETSGIEAAVAKTPKGSFYVIPEGRYTVGHATTFMARTWAAQFKKFMDSIP